MHSSTARYIRFLNSFVDDHFGDWMARYPNIIGCHIDHKVRDGVAKRYYCIQFVVAGKSSYLPPEHLIPPFFEIEVPERGLTKVPTDVIESKVAENCSGRVNPGSKAWLVHFENDSGTFGALVENQDQQLLALSNFHVFGSKWYSQQKNGHTYTPGELKDFVWMEDSSGNGTRAVYSKGKAFFEVQGKRYPVDAALAVITDRSQVENFYKEIGFPTGTKEYGQGNWRDVSVSMVGAASMAQTGHKKTAQIKDLNARHLWNTPWGQKVYFGMIRISPPISTFGDSGAALINEARQVVGIVKGSTSTSTYAIPISRIMRMFELTLHKGPIQ